MWILLGSDEVREILFRLPAFPPHGQTRAVRGPRGRRDRPGRADRVAAAPRGPEDPRPQGMAAPPWPLGPMALPPLPTRVLSLDVRPTRRGQRPDRSEPVPSGGVGSVPVRRARWVRSLRVRAVPGRPMGREIHRASAAVEAPHV